MYIKDMWLKTVFCGGYLILASSSQAQYYDLIRNPDVSWIAEYTTDYWMNPENEEDSSMPPNTLELIRLNRTDLENGLYGRLISTRKYLSQQVMESIQDPKAKIYKDSLLKFTMSSEEFSQSIISQDTGYSSCNGEMVIIQHEVEYSEIFSFRIRQVF